MLIDKVYRSNSLSFNAYWIKNSQYKQACDEALRFKNGLKYMNEGEKSLLKFPNHELALYDEGIRNLTTNKYHEFPVVVKDEIPFENLMYFYDMLKEGDKFIKKLFSK